MKWQYYLTYLAALSLVTFLLYGLDKTRAKKKSGRIPEKTFHILTLLGGFIGGWAGRYAFHHKTKKGVFTLVLVISTVIHAALFYLLFLN